MDEGVRSFPTLSIAAVERDTGLSKDTLRVWERRYGFPQPMRDQNGERVYPADQVDRLRAIRRLMDAGHRPGRIIGLGPEELDELARRVPSDQVETSADVRADQAALMALVRNHDVPNFRRELGQRLMRLGLERFVTELAGPLIHEVGETWARGDLEIYEEHLFTESMEVVLRNAISTIPPPKAAPKILLTTFPGESHGMGLLMVEALMAIEGCPCVSLGVQTPVWDIVLAAKAQRADVVALSFSSASTAPLIFDGLLELREKLPLETEVWVGGRASALRRRTLLGVRVLEDLQAIRPEVERWRTEKMPG